ncbi:MAG: Gfo/Idh/MocA family oxidoreductase [Nitrospiria bacterium]
MNTPLTFGIIGAGAIAQTWAQAFEAFEDATVIGVADVRADAARGLADRLGCPAYESHEALMSAAPCDAVVICTPPATHPELAMFFLERKVHVLCEKPLAIDSASARLMLETARATGSHLTMASKFRYVDDVVRAKSLVLSGILGEIILFENAFTARVEMGSRWNANPALSGGGVLIDNGAHSIDLMRYFLGPLAEVQVVEGKRSQGLSVEETVRIFARSVTGVMGSVDLSWSINKELDSYINIYGSHGTVSVGWKESKYRQTSSREWVVFGKGYDKIQAFRSQLKNFSRVVRGEDVPLITAEDALASVAVIEAGYASMRGTHWIPVKSHTAALRSVPGGGDGLCRAA